jgi:hypothetical protein
VWVLTDVLIALLLQEELLELEEERALHAAYKAAAAQVGGTPLCRAVALLAAAAAVPSPPLPLLPLLATRCRLSTAAQRLPLAAQVSSDMDVPAFLVATEQLIAPLDAFFDKVFVMCEDEVRRGAARCER